MTAPDPLGDLFDVYRTVGEADYIGEPVSQVEHAAQAAHRASRAGARAEAVVAAFLHDVGHLCADEAAARMDGLGVVAHEQVGADALRAAGLPEDCAALVALHVAAKRYQCQARPEYLARLSAASVGTLAFQGGPMDDAEAAAFEAHPLFPEALALRAWDEAAKVVGGDGLGVDAVEALARTLVDGDE